MWKQLMGFITGIQNQNKQQNQNVKNYTADQNFAKGGGVSPLPATPNPAPPLQQQPIFQKLMSVFMKPQQTQAAPVNSVPTTSQVLKPTNSVATTPSPTPTPGWVPYKQAYDKFYADRGTPPVSKYTELMAKLTYDNPNLKRNPGVVAGVPLLETSGAVPTKMAFANNPVNWGIQMTKQGKFSPQSIEETLTKMATGLDHRQTDFTTTQGLSDWRKTGNLESLGTWYAPPSDNPEHGGKVYGQRLAAYDSEIKNILKQFGVK